MIKLLCIVNMLLLVAGQVLFKAGALGKSINNLLDVIKLFFTPTVFCALCLYATTTVLWLYIVNKIELSVAMPLQSLSLPLIILCSVLFFNESVALSKWLGIIMICAGVYIATR